MHGRTLELAALTIALAIVGCYDGAPGSGDDGTGASDAEPDSGPLPGLLV